MGRFTFRELREAHGTRLLSCGEEYEGFLSRFPKLGEVYGSRDRVVGTVFQVRDYVVVRTDYNGIGVRLDPRWLDPSLAGDPDGQWDKIFFHLHVVVS